MNITEYVECDATALGGLMRSGDVTAGEVYAAALDAIAEVNKHLNAVADGPWAEPLDYRADGPLAGVPFVMKDLGPHIAGVPTRMGTRLSGEGLVFSYDSFLTRRFRDAGLAIAGLTTAPEFGANANSEALVYGSTRNPWDLTRSVGGSSGGTGALVGAGGVPVGHANDGGGSIRIPAAVNGLVGLKPSRGRTSEGPDRQEHWGGVSSEGVHTRTMRDCAALLDAMAGPMPGDKFVIKEPARPWLQEVGADPGRLRIAVHTASWSGSAVDPEVVAAVEAVARKLEELGHQVEWATPSFEWETFVPTMLTLYTALWLEAVELTSAQTGKQPGPETLEHTTLACYEHGRHVSVSQLGEAMRNVNEIARKVGDFFTRYDLLLTPTIARPPLPLGYLNANDPSLDAEGWLRRLLDVIPFTPLFNLTGTPAVSLPLGSTSEGLPIGVQLAAPMCDEATLIRVGSQMEEAMPWRTRRPPIWAGHVAEEIAGS